MLCWSWWYCPFNDAMKWAEWNKLVETMVYTSFNCSLVSLMFLEIRSIILIDICCFVACKSCCKCHDKSKKTNHSMHALRTGATICRASLSSHSYIEITLYVRQIIHTWIASMECYCINQITSWKILNNAPSVSSCFIFCKLTDIILMNPKVFSP